MLLPNPDKVAAAIRETAEIEVMPLFGKLATGDIREKAPGDLVSIADEASERHLTERLGALLPGSVVVGEESAAADAKVLDHLSAQDSVWIVDPIDGTLNFCAGIPIFAVMVALVRRGETVGGWIFDPVNDEMLSAIKGEGAWLNGTRVKVNKGLHLDEMRGALARLSVPDKARQAELGQRYIFHGEEGDFRCAGREYKELACGGRQFTTFYNLKPWDHAPGLLIHDEAGGHSAMMDDEKPYSFLRHQGPLLAAPSHEAWLALRELIYRT